MLSTLFWGHLRDDMLNLDKGNIVSWISSQLTLFLGSHHQLPLPNIRVHPCMLIVVEEVAGMDIDFVVQCVVSQVGPVTSQIEAIFPNIIWRSA